jgi:hypothetical protein
MIQNKYLDHGRHGGPILLPTGDDIPLQTWNPNVKATHTYPKPGTQGESLPYKPGWDTNSCG